jgi:hypothetical protein
MTKKLTYRQLFARLRGLGYHDQKVELNGVTQHVLRHKDIDSATIILQERPSHERVHPMHLLKVRAVLKVHDLLPNGQEPALF